jgi:COP9 signalosome complex subunit 1
MYLLTVDMLLSCLAGRRRIERLLFVARSCPALRVKAFQLALDTIKTSSLDHRLYQEVANECRDVEIDEKWMEDARVKQESGLEKLDVELKNYQNNLIKESIRVCSCSRYVEVDAASLTSLRQMGYRDIGDFQRKSGDASGAIKSYAKSKEYCTTSQHILDMSLSVVDVSGGLQYNDPANTHADCTRPAFLCYRQELCLEGRVSTRARQRSCERPDERCKSKRQSARYGHGRTRQKGGRKP